ncbi:MAG: hypothetical protein SVS15_03800 [Thermodesulfobacteriota bacterium]|nr:hypothetical protein [Thermodesulfobacteriota bacterium]
MGKSKYNVLMMRDDTPVRRYRLSSGWLKLALYSLGLLVLCAGAGVFAGVKFWAKSNALLQERRDMEHRIQEAYMEMERLQNIEKILKSNDPKDMQSLLGSMSAETVRKQPARPPVDLNKVFSRIDLRQVKVDNLQVKFVGRYLRVTFHLNNMLSSGTLVGQGDIKLLTAGGDLLDVGVKKSDLAFQIQRFKQIATMILLPKNHSRNSLFGLRLVITDPSGKTIFSEAYPLSQILA